MFNTSFSREEGQGLVEYALILVLVAIVVIAVLLLLGPAINQAFCRVANALEAGTCGAISTVGVDVGTLNMSGKYDTVKITVTTSESVTVNVTVSGESPQSATCNSSCSFNFSNVSPGNYTVTASDGSKVSGSF